MRYDSKILVIEITLLFCSMLFIPLAAYLDTAIFKNRLSEVSLTELSQSTIVLTTAILLYKKAIISSTLKGTLFLASTLLTMMFIREADYYLDFVYHGFWKVPVFIVFSIGVYTVIKRKLPIITPLKQAIHTKAFGYMMCGLFITLVFSRLFGTGTIWRTMLPYDDATYIKNIIQESLELLGYCITFLGALILHLPPDKSDDNSTHKSTDKKTGNHPSL